MLAKNNMPQINAQL